jgi:hypothetical protein
MKNINQDSNRVSLEQKSRMLPLHHPVQYVTIGANTADYLVQVWPTCGPQSPE